MSFWLSSPGPHWSDFLKSCLPLCWSQKPFLFENDLIRKPRDIVCPPSCSSSILSEKDAEEIANLLKSDYDTFPRSRILLSPERIRNGFRLDQWLACGVRSSEGILIGCCFSRNLGTLYIEHESFPGMGLVDFFCVAKDWRKKNIGSFLLQELVYLTATHKRLTHIFMKEGLPLSPLPPIWQSHYIVREKISPRFPPEKLSLVPISTRMKISRFLYLESIPTLSSIWNKLPYMTGDSEIFVYQESQWRVFLCITNTFHRSVPEGKTIGEILWAFPRDPKTPVRVIEQAVEALVDNCVYDLILLDSSWPHDKKRDWKKDAMYGWYLFNVHPGRFMGIKPYWIL